MVWRLLTYISCIVSLTSFIFCQDVSTVSTIERNHTSATEGLDINTVVTETTSITVSTSSIHENDDNNTSDIISTTEKLTSVSSTKPLISSTVPNTSPITEVSTPTLSPEMKVVEAWESMEESLKNMIDRLLKMALPTLLQSSSNLQISSSCSSSLFQLIVALRLMKPWAFYMLDAMSKPLTGTLAGSMASFGAYDECLDLMVHHHRTGKFQFQGQYCAMEIKLPLPPKPHFHKLQRTLNAFANFSREKDTILRDISKIAHLFYAIPFRMDLCVPSTCSTEDIRNIVSSATSGYNLKAEITRCELKKEWTIADYQIAIFSIFGVFVIFIIIGSCLETFYLYSGVDPKEYCNKRIIPKLFLSFSIYSNTRVLFNTNVTEERLSMLHGLKAFTMMWMIFANVYFATERLCFSTLRQMTKFPNNEIFQALINYSLSIDNLFFASGVVIAYMNLRSVDKYNKKFCIFAFVLRRLWRTIPSLMLLISVSLILPMLGSGPLWSDIMNPHIENCKRYWWTNLLLINNFYPEPRETCFSYATYYAADIQLYIISALVFVPLLAYRLNKLAAFINLFIIMGSVLSTAIVTYYYNLPPTMLFTYVIPDDIDEIKHIIFHKPYCHMGAFFVGIATGWFLYKNRESKMKLHHHLFGWPIALSGSMAILFGVYEWNRGNVPCDLVSAIYAGVHRSSWAITLAWLTIACFYGQAGFIKKIFAWKALVPLSRMTFVSFLIQYMVLLFISGFLRERIQPNHLIAFFLACGLFVITYLLSYGCYILFDGPIESLKRLIFDCSKSQLHQNICFTNDTDYVTEDKRKSYNLYKVNSEK